MASEEIEQLHRAMDAFNRRDRAGWLAACHTECVNIPPKEWPEQAPVRGAEAVWDFFIDALSSWEHAEFQFVEPFDAGTEMVIANQVASLRGKSSGVEVLWSYWVLFKFQDGRVIGMEWLADRDEAIEAARLQQGLTNT